MKCKCKWVSERGIFSIKEMKKIWKTEVNKDEYPEFSCWLFDMERNGTFVLI